jgi:hypothetical protein
LLDIGSTSGNVCVKLGFVIPVVGERSIDLTHAEVRMLEVKLLRAPAIGLLRHYEFYYFHRRTSDYGNVLFIEFHMWVGNHRRALHGFSPTRN